MAAYCAVPPDDPFAASKALFDGLAAELAGPAAAGLTACELEELLDERGREVLRQLLQDHFDLRAAREEQQARERRAPVTGTDGIARTRLETGHGRGLATLFGTVRVTRCAWRKPGAGNWRPADAALSLPAGRHSHCLAKLAALEAARGSFGAAHDAVTRRCGPVMGKRQLEQAVTSAAADIPAFYAARIPEPCTSATLLILSADCKGIVMRPGALRAATARAAARLGKMRTRLSAGEKPNRKRMAALVTVYDAEPAKRRPHDVIAPPGGRCGTREPRKGPRARSKWLSGSVRRDPAEMIAAASGEAEARDPGHLRTWVVLVDGAEHQLELIRAEAARRGTAIHVIIDIIHVLGYLWKAAWSLHTAGDPAAEDWVAVKALAVLAGDSERAAAAITAEADAAGLHRKPAHRSGHLRAVPAQQAAVPPLRPGPPSRLADRDRDHRGSMPAPHRRPPRYRRGQMGPGRRRSRPDPARGHQQRRLRGVLALPSSLRAPAALPRHRTGPVHAWCLTGQLTPNELHPSESAHWRSRRWNGGHHGK